MDFRRFDALTKTIGTTDTRRALLRLGAALPLSAGLAGLLAEATEAGREHRRSTKHRHRTGNNKEHRKGKRRGKRRCARAGQMPKTGKRGKRTKCCAGLVTDASGRCAASAPSSQPSRDCIGLKPTDDLQAAIEAAEDKATLTLCAGTWDLTETVVIGKKLTLIGAGAGQTTLDGGRPPSGPGGVRVLQIEPGAEVTLQDLTITKGYRSVGSFPTNAGGGISNEGTLTLLGVSVTGNKAASDGGGIFNNRGTLTLGANSRVTGNTAEQYGGGIGNYYGTATLEANSQVTNNTTVHAGGIFNLFGEVTLEAGSRVSDNTASAGGGGIYNISPSADTVTVNQGALVCNNTQSTTSSQCVNVASNCPNPPSGTCPP